MKIKGNARMMYRNVLKKICLFWYKWHSSYFLSPYACEIRVAEPCTNVEVIEITAKPRVKEPSPRPASSLVLSACPSTAAFTML